MPQVLYPDVINNLKLFSGLSDQEKGELLKEGKLQWFPKGHYLFRRGDPISHFYIVCNGVMQLTRETPDGEEITTDVITRGKTICKNEIFHARATHHQINGVVIEDITVIDFPAAWLKKIAATNVTVALNILSSLSQYGYMVEVELEHKSNMTTAQQVACFLQRLCLMHEFDPRGFNLPYSKSLIASRLGMEPETFSRTLGKLKEHGIEIKDTHVSFLDMKKIDDYVCGHCSIAEDCQTRNTLQRIDVNAKSSAQ